MPRRNEIAKILLISSMLVLGGVVSASAQLDFDSYYKETKSSPLTLRVRAVAEGCGVSLSGSPLYGMSLGEAMQLKRVPSLGSGRDEAQTDFFSTAEVWSVDGRPRIVNVWMLVMDTGNTQNEIYCLDIRGRVISQESMNRWDDVQETKRPAWIYLQRIRYVPLKKELSRIGSFINDRGARIQAPKLNKEDLAAAQRESSRTLAATVLQQLAVAGK